MRDVLLVVDVIDDFRHEDGDKLLASFRDKLHALRAVLQEARSRRIPVIYANDNRGLWDRDVERQVVDAMENGYGCDVVEALKPLPDEPVILKPRYSAFDLTPLELLLVDVGAERLLTVGASLEMCVTQTAIDARERGLKVSVLAAACPSIDPDLGEVALRYLEGVAGVFVHRAPGLP